ncbi:hypothetical protein GPECTOR_10g777 [Gonium pectorale]|uniref:J domain-containing protein n=1 Tax=Gonium pectorale TaxID=33097 RepID=A0A150GQY4_GONPE|nr:hypothetical protein GPECTOR_10g777 [Gonium pectorale]|eukprot:KXZ52148.1 hypothetical protein GPECTOR_10g777 [Gonium pectorale]
MGPQLPDGPTSNPLGEPNVDFNDIFSLRKPRDAKAGLASGLKSIAKGVLGGAAGLVAAPIVGAQRDGVTGFAKGLASGVVGAVVLPVTGVGVGAVQMVRGVINTPEAVMQASKDMLWDEERRVWVDKNMIVPLQAQQQKGGRGRAGAGGFNRPESGDDYYAILQVPRDATAEAIKKQYYILARKYHPDKNPGDASAHEKFQKLGEAYQVLGNEQLRERYDTHGTEGLDVNFMDGGAFFHMLFGSDQFEHLVGELLIALAARSGGELTAADMTREQGVRVQKLCVNLIALLKRYTQGDEEGFTLAMREEAGRLVGASFGETMLHTIGKVYDMQADIATGGFFGGMAAKFRSQGESMRSQFQAASAAIKVYAAQQKIEAWQKEQERKAAHVAAASSKPVQAAGTEGGSGDAAAPGTAAEEGGAASTAGTASASATTSGNQAHAGSTAAGTPPSRATDASQPGANDPAAAGSAPPPGPSIEQLMERQRLEEAALPLMLEAMWAANVLDIQSTLRKVCKFVLCEEGVPRDVLAARANALKILGGIFMQAKGPESQTDAKRQMEEAMLRVVEKRAAQEGGAEDAGEGASP